MSGGAFTGACLILFDRFWRRYLDKSGDDEMLAVVAPFLAFRGLVLASPIWYSDTPDPIRERLLILIEQTLNQDRFEPDRIDDYLAHSDKTRLGELKSKQAIIVTHLSANPRQARVRITDRRSSLGLVQWLYLLPKGSEP